MSKIIKLADHQPSEIAKRCRKQLEKTDASISGETFAKMSGVPIHEITDFNERSVVLDIAEASLPLVTAIKNASKIAKNALEYQDHENAAEIQTKALTIMLEAMNKGSVDYCYNLGVAKRIERENENAD